MTPKHFCKASIRPVLAQIGLHSEEAEELLLGTALVESDLKHRIQVGGGPGRGYFQMEATTHDDIWENFLKFRKSLGEKISKLLSKPDADKLAELETNDRYAIAMARVHYLRVAEPLPKSGEVQAMAAYWKKYYNTLLGKGTREQFIEKWNKAMKK